MTPTEGGGGLIDKIGLAFLGLPVVDVSLKHQQESGQMTE